MKLDQLLKRNEGSVAVEFVLILPVILVLIFGIIEMGEAWHRKQMLVAASREGARLGSLLNTENISDAEVVAHVTSRLNLFGYPSTFNVTCTGAGNVTGSNVTVQVTAPYNFPVLSNLVPGVLPTITLTEVTVMRHE